MQIRNYYDVAPDLKSIYFANDRNRDVLNVLQENENLFWEYVNLLYLVGNQIYLDEKPGASLLVLTGKFINHSVMAYKMLLEAMVDEFFILFRQSCEVKWLSQYFIKHPNKEEEWLSSKKNYFAPKEVRKAIDEDGRIKNFYSYLSNNVHPKTESINNILDGNIILAGNFDETFSKYAFLLLLLTIDEFITNILDVVVLQKGIDIQSPKKLMKEVSNEDEELFILAVGQYSILSKKLDSLRDQWDKE